VLVFSASINPHHRFYWNRGASGYCLWRDMTHYKTVAFLQSVRLLIGATSLPQPSAQQWLR
jgi:hypothetical protein